jgi:hypothetical protein
MKSCPECGREYEQGFTTHWLGCPAISRVEPEKAPEPIGPREDPEIEGEPKPEEVEPEVEPTLVALCDFAGCENPKRPAGKGPKPKYCEAHKDPKSRKE